MPSPTYQQNKKHILKWQQANKRKHYENSYKYQKKRYAFRQECKIFLKILME